MKPILKALLLAERIYEDRETGRKIIAGTLTELAVSEADAAVSVYVFITLTEVRRKTALVLQYVDLDGETLRHVDFEVTGENPLDIIEVTVRLTRLPAPYAGEYAFDLLCVDGTKEELLGSHRLEVTQTEGNDDENVES